METVNSFCDYFCYCYDKLKSESPCTAIIAAGDFNPDSNGLNIRTITHQCHIKQIVKTPTRGNAVLDVIIMDIHKFYEDPEILPPPQPRSRGFSVRTRGETRKPWSGPVT
jgi:hypothetical protein